MAALTASHSALVEREAAAAAAVALQTKDVAAVKLEVYDCTGRKCSSLVSRAVCLNCNLAEALAKHVSPNIALFVDVCVCVYICVCV